MEEISKIYIINVYHPVYEIVVIHSKITQ